MYYRNFASHIIEGDKMSLVEKASFKSCLICITTFGLA